MSNRAARRWTHRGLPAIADAPAGPETAARPEARGFTELRRLYEMHLAHRRMNPEQIATIRCGLKVFGAYLEAAGVEEVREVTPELVEGFALYAASAETRDGAPYSSRTITQWFVNVRNLFRWLTARGVILADPTTKLEDPRVPKTIPRDLPSVEEVRSLIAAPDTSTVHGMRDRAMIEVLYATGLRSSELVSLDVADFDSDARTLAVRQGKPKKDRLIPLLGVVCDVLRTYIDGPREKLIGKQPDQKALFPSQWGERMNRKDFSAMVARYGHAAGIEKPVTPMAIRHALATHLLAASVSIRHIQSLLGHKSVETTTVYAKVTPLDLQNQLRRFHPRQRSEGRSHQRKPGPDDTTPGRKPRGKPRPSAPEAGITLSGDGLSGPVGHLH